MTRREAPVDESGPVDEGVVKYELRSRSGSPPSVAAIRPLAGWRRVLVALGALGCDPARYGGHGFGNLSARLPDRSGELRFLITGTGTGGIGDLAAEHWTTVTHCDPAANRIDAEGPIAPSSEALTHGAVYGLAATIGAVFHVHAPELWCQAAELGLPVSSPDVAYGTPAMATEVVRLATEDDLLGSRVFAMGGHTDGIVAFGDDADAAGAVLVTQLARAAARAFPSGDR